MARGNSRSASAQALTTMSLKDGTASPSAADCLQRLPPLDRRGSCRSPPGGRSAARSPSTRPSAAPRSAGACVSSTTSTCALGGLRLLPRARRRPCARRLRRAPRRAAASRGAPRPVRERLLDVGLDDPPPGPRPAQRWRVQPRSCAIRRAIGEALTRPPSPARRGGGCAARRLRLARLRPAVRRGCRLRGGRGGRPGGLRHLRPPPLASAPPVAARGRAVARATAAAPLRRLAASPTRAITSPIGNVSPSCATISLSVPARSAS